MNAEKITSPTKGNQSSKLTYLAIIPAPCQISTQFWFSSAMGITQFNFVWFQELTQFTERKSINQNRDDEEKHLSKHVICSIVKQSGVKIH